MCTAGDRTEGLGGLEAGARAAPLSTSQHAEQAARHQHETSAAYCKARITAWCKWHGASYHLCADWETPWLLDQAGFLACATTNRRKKNYKIYKKKKKNPSRGEKKNNSQLRPFLERIFYDGRSMILVRKLELFQNIIYNSLTKTASCF